MLSEKISIVFAILSVMVGHQVLAQVEQLSAWEQQQYILQLPALAQKAQAGPLKQHLQNVVKQGVKDKAAINAARVALDAMDTAGAQMFVHYAVSPMSENQRLPDLYPLDGQINTAVGIIAAKGEYEPGAFVIYPLADLGKVSLTLTEFKTREGKIFPADQLDLKLLKVWYQNKNAWYSYFGDTGFKLVSELLVNDEDLIRTDDALKANYARLKGADGAVRLHWINPPREMDQRFPWHYRSTSVFAPMKPDFADAEKLQPVSLKEGQFATFFLTAHVSADAAAGIYHGSVRLSHQGKALGVVPISIRVLPFALPDPMTYFDTDQEYLTASYSYISLDTIMEENGGDFELAKKQLRATLRNQVEHNQTIHWIRGDRDREVMLTTQIMKEVGMHTDILLGGVYSRPVGGALLKSEIDYAARRARQWADTYFGHHNVYIGHGDEPGPKWLMSNRPIFEGFQRVGFKFIIAGHGNVFHKAGYVYDWHNTAEWPEAPGVTERWNEIGQAKVAWYAAMHVGSENPAFNRRQYGMTPYLNNYSAVCNYAHHYGPYNDDRTTYRPMVFAYGIYGGVLDTIQWEGYREGIDDIRYATLLKRLARQSGKSEVLETRYAGNQALQYLATLSPTEGDLDTVRYEMIRHIMKLRAALAIKD